MSNDPNAETRTMSVVTRLAERLSVDMTGARILHQHSNAVIALPVPGWVVRIASAPDALDRITQSVRVTGWLADQGFPCVIPVSGIDQPLVVDGSVVSLWHFVPATPPAGQAGAALGHLLRRLHHQPLLPFPLPWFDDPFDDVSAAVRQAPDAMTAASRSWLLSRLDGLGRQWPLLPFTRRWALIHGDAHPNNLLHTPDGPILADWDHTAIGPREWDLAQIHYTRRRFGRPTAAEADSFAAAYGWDIRTWDSLDTVIAAREITGLSPYIRNAHRSDFARAELASRLSMLADGDALTRWTSPAST
ncbi:aminoglycoside phosphotransferase family protein [Streptomyces sp. NPDC091377]|uniref:aminoglycoside phosphotransferase family protein n=1 Tax=Streptomyces sp. NPDC091377 TaxID=3365995 RepID=UPI0037F6C93A